MNEWNIQSRAHACQACGKHFVDKQLYHTALFDVRHEVQRLDVCDACWKAEHADSANSRPGFVSQWQGLYEAPPAAPPEAIKKENAESLLRKLLELNEPRYMAASYILAAMLERKRILKVKEQFRRERQRIFVYEHPKTGDIFTIPDPDLQLNQLEEVQRDVASLLEHGLPGGESLAPTSGPAGAPAAEDAAAVGLDGPAAPSESPAGSVPEAGDPALEPAADEVKN